VVSPDTWIPLAEVARPHGVRGELRLKLFNKDSDVLLAMDEVLVRLADGEEHEVSVDGARRADDAILLKLHSIDDRDRADEVRGALICVRRKDFPALEDGEFYACDIEGLNVLLAGEKPTPVGKVKELRNYPSIDALVVTAADGGKDWEIPLVDVFVESVDVEAGRVILKTVEGLERS
jgi:16S rRNA processing protein RimM